MDKRELSAERTEKMLKAARERHAGGVMGLARDAGSNGGPDLNARDESGYTALDYMLEQNQLQAAQELIKLGGDVGEPNRPLGGAGFPPLHWAAWMGEPVWAHALIERGADPLATTGGGMSALAYALKQERVDVAQVLKKNGANVKIKLEGPDGSLLAMCAHRALASSVVWCLKNKAYGADADKELARAVETLSDMTVRAPGQENALGAAKSSLEALELRRLTKKAEGAGTAKTKRSGL